MNLDIFKQPDPSGSLSKENFVHKKYKEEFDYINQYCLDNGLEYLPFKEKAYHAIHDINHVVICKNPTCNNLVKYKNSTLGYLTYCSNRCIGLDPDVIKQKEANSISKFGTKTPAESAIIKEKIIATNNEKYGRNSAMCLISTQNKSKDTLMLNYGVSNPAHSDILLSKRVDSFKKNIEQFKKTYKNTSISKYGVEHPWMNKEIHNKAIEVFYKDYKDRIITKIDSSRYDFIDFKSNPTILSLLCKTCNNHFDILPYQFYYRIKSRNSICTNCYPISDNSSLMQTELYRLICDNYDGVVECNVRGIIKPYEIDIYLPDINMAFEFNGLYWHSDIHKDSNYHYKKHKLAMDNNINLVTIWEDDWLFKEDIIKSFILNKLDKTENRIFARKCKIIEIDYNTSKSFLNDNHLQGDVKSPIRIGLYYDTELVSLMTFSSLRVALSAKKKNGVYELTRFVNKTNCLVVGGASKILKYFVNRYNPIEIQSYSDNLISNGGLYKTLGFECRHTSRPGYWYVVNDKREHRYNWRKSKLVELGFDKEKSESTIMSELGHNRIYNAGNKKWVLINKKI